MTQRGYRSGKMGQCLECKNVFKLTGTGTLAGHKCSGQMRYRQIPEVGSVWTGYGRSVPRRLTARVDGKDIKLHGGLIDPLVRIQEISDSSTLIGFHGGQLDLFECVSCGSPLSNPIKRPIYCTQFCRALTEAIRYHRRRLSDGRYEQDPLVRSAIRVNLRKLSSGVVIRPTGISSEVRDEVFARTNGICAISDCSNTATDLDHINGRGGGDAADNLQGLCNGCHLKISESEDKPLSPEMIADRKDVIESGLLVDFWERYAARALANSPLAACDDHLHWESKWREVAKNRRATWKQLTNCVYCGDLVKPDDLTPDGICGSCEHEHIFNAS